MKRCPTSEELVNEEGELAPVEALSPEEETIKVGAIYGL